AHLDAVAAVGLRGRGVALDPARALAAIARQHAQQGARDRLAARVQEAARDRGPGAVVDRAARLGRAGAVGGELAVLGRAGAVERPAVRRGGDIDRIRTLL